MSAPLPDLLPAPGAATAAPVRKRPRGRASTLRIWLPARLPHPAGRGVLHLAADLPGPQAGRRQHPGGRPAAVLAGPHPRHRPERQRRTLPHPVRGTGLVRGRVQRHRHRPRHRRPARHGRRLLARRRRRGHLPGARRADRVSRARARARHRRGPGAQRAARDLGACHLQHPRLRPDRPQRHPGHPRAEFHAGGEAVRQPRPPHHPPSRHPQHHAAAHDVRPARLRHRHHPRGGAQLPRPGHPPARAELGEHDRAGPAGPVRHAGARADPERLPVRHRRLAERPRRCASGNAGASDERRAAAGGRGPQGELPGPPRRAARRQRDELFALPPADAGHRRRVRIG